MISDWDDAYANAPHIIGGETYIPRWEARASAFRAAMAGRLREIAYGPHPRQRIDLFLPEAAPRGLIVYIHGGYWRQFEPSTWSHLAGGALARGWAVAMPGYVLAPEVRVAAISAMIAEAVEAAAGEVAGPLRLAGHSAGGHLAVRQVCADSRLAPGTRARLTGVLAISGLYDLRPMLRLTLNQTLHLDAAEAAAESPALGAPLPDAPVIHAWVGDDERPEFLRQSALIANIWTGLGADVTLTIEPRRHHFNVIDGLTHPGSGLVEALVGEPLP
jgi:acetyl esterase/lipase